ncbi:hypothetical protein V1509DRAFT_510380 [Lipomyces kononenkoae]
MCDNDFERALREKHQWHLNSNRRMCINDRYSLIWSVNSWLVIIPVRPVLFFFVFCCRREHAPGRASRGKKAKWNLLLALAASFLWPSLFCCRPRAAAATVAAYRFTFFFHLLTCLVTIIWAPC